MKIYREQLEEYYSDDHCRNTLLGLIVSCPFDKCASDCILSKARLTPLHDRYEMVMNLTEEERRAIYKLHAKCSYERWKLENS